jgi:hypothetical protein
MLWVRRGREPNVTGRPASVIPLFITVFTRSIILPGNGNYRYYLNAGIIAMTMNGTTLGLGRRSSAPHQACDTQARGTRR